MHLTYSSIKQQYDQYILYIYAACSCCWKAVRACALHVREVLLLLSLAAEVCLVSATTVVVVASMYRYTADCCINNFTHLPYSSKCYLLVYLQQL